MKRHPVVAMLVGVVESEARAELVAAALAAEVLVVGPGPEREAVRRLSSPEPDRLAQAMLGAAAARDLLVRPVPAPKALPQVRPPAVTRGLSGSTTPRAKSIPRSSKRCRRT